MQDSVADERIDISLEAAEEARLGISTHGSTERFIPISQHELIEHLTRPEVWPPEELKSAKTLFKFMIHWRHLMYADHHQELVRVYQPFSPDTDLASFNRLTKAEATEYQTAFVEHVRRLLERANYEEIPLDRIDDILSEQNPYGLEFHVDLDEFEELHIFFRGQSETTVRPGLLERHVMRKKPVVLPIYQRLFVMLKLKPLETRVREIMLKEQIEAKRAEKIVTRLRKSLPKAISGDYIYLKLFKFIPRADLEMLFPNTRVKIRKLDKFKLGITAGGGTTAGIVTTATKLATVAALTNPVTVGLAVAGLCGVVFRQVTNIFNTRTQYMAQLSENLYFHNLANNAGVLSILSERGQEEDVKEEVLLYTLLARSRVRRSELGEAKAAIEQFLRTEFNVTPNFDILDALERLEQDGLVQQQADGTLRALPPREAAAHIDKLWDKHLDEIARRDDVPLDGGVG